MDWTQAITIICTILIPMISGFAWILHKIGVIESRVTVIETILAMMGMPIRERK